MGWIRERAGLLLCGLLAACGDGAVITHVSGSSAMTSGFLRSMALCDGLATEIHGQPWAGGSPEAVAAALRPPNSFPPELRFRAIAAGTRNSAQEPSKLVLVFNGGRPLDPGHVCAAIAGDLAGSGPRQQGFDVFAVLCGRNGWVGHGMMRADRWTAGDETEFTRLMRRLFIRMLDHGDAR